MQFSAIPVEHHLGASIEALDLEHAHLNPISSSILSVPMTLSLFLVMITWQHRIIQPKHIHLVLDWFALCVQLIIWEWLFLSLHNMLELNTTIAYNADFISCFKRLLSNVALSFFLHIVIILISNEGPPLEGNKLALLYGSWETCSTAIVLKPVYHSLGLYKWALTLITL